jgi:hypothetical protein
MSDTSWSCYLKGIGTEGIPSNGDIGMMKTRLDKLQSVADAYKELTEKQAALCERMDRIEKRRRDEAGDVDQGDPAAAEPLAARS